MSDAAISEQKNAQKPLLLGAFFTDPAFLPTQKA